jgi:hypothetical protein
MKWITREHIKVDRVACPWLIARFVDPARLLAQFPVYDALYVYCQSACRAHGPSSVRFHRLRRQLGPFA